MTVIEHVRALTAVLPTDVAVIIGDQLMNAVRASQKTKGLGIADRLPGRHLRRDQWRSFGASPRSTSPTKRRRSGASCASIFSRSCMTFGAVAARPGGARRHRGAGLPAASVAEGGAGDRDRREDRRLSAADAGRGRRRFVPLSLRSLARGCAVEVDYAGLPVRGGCLAAPDLGVRVLRRPLHQLSRKLRFTGRGRGTAHLDVSFRLCVRLRRRAQQRNRAPDRKGQHDRQARADGRTRCLGGGQCRDGRQCPGSAGEAAGGGEADPGRSRRSRKRRARRPEAAAARRPGAAALPAASRTRGPRSAGCARG